MNNFVDDLKDWFRDFVKALIFFLLLQTYVAQGFVIEGACMEPELHSHEKILVNKMVYHLKEPEIGEVVVFTYPYQPDKDFIKRVVGVPGDEIAIKDGYLYRNGKKMNESFVKEDTIYIIQGKFDEKSNNENNICNIKNININNNDNNNSSRRDINLNFKHLKSKELQLNNEKINTNKNLSIQLSNRSNRSNNNKEKLNFINLKRGIAQKNKIKLDIYSENNIP